jgi:hypothetical protein
MNEQDDLARRIAAHLDEGTRRLGRVQRDRLMAARQEALARHRSAPVPALQPQWAGPLARFTERKLFGVRYVVPIAALVLGLAGVVYMNSNGNSSVELADIDAGLLTDELPIRAYLDQGFDSWLKRLSH